jgi:hypothetical protein
MFGLWEPRCLKKGPFRAWAPNLSEALATFAFIFHFLLKELKITEDQRQLLEQRLPHFQDDVIATELLNYLPCLTDEQKDQIAYDEKNYLPSKGVRTLVEKLEEYEEGFEQFVLALCKADLGHVAVLLDANFKSRIL